MKLACALVLLALAVGVQCSWYGGPALAYGSHAVHAAGPYAAGWAGPWGGAWHGAPAAVDVSVGAPWGYAGYGGYAGAWGGYPGVSLSQGPSHLGAHGAHGGHGVYVAKTRGALHTAPLAGHINSATALNVAPAPGTH